MQELGVRYALALDGSVADPKTAPKLERAYLCLDCKEHVHVRRGEVRRPYFAHYAERPHPCSAETVAHEAAKRKLVSLLLDGTRSLEFWLACRGYADVLGDARACPDDARLERSLEVPDFDTAGVEVAFGPYRMDAAASSAGRVVLGLEVYQSHLVDPAKRAVLTAAGLPWAELPAEEVLEKSMPWAVVTSSFGPHQCEGCAGRDAAALAERRRRAAAEAARREAAQQEAEREAQRARLVPFAQHENRVVFGWRRNVGKRCTCLVCKEPVIGVAGAQGNVEFLHESGHACDPRRAWVRAGMLAVYNQLKEAPRAVRILRRCSGQGCTHIFRERAPDFDTVRGDEPSLILLKAGVPVLQLAFGREPTLIGTVEALELRPGKVVHKPAVWWRRKNGRFCDACTERFTRLTAEAEARHEALVRESEARRQAEEARRQAEAELFRARWGSNSPPAPSRTNGELHLTLLRRKAERLNQDPERVRLAAEFARRYLTAHGVGTEHARTFGVVVRRCEHCRKPVAALFLHGVPEVPPGLEHIVEVYPNHVVGSLLHNRCGGCSGRLSNAHEQTEPNRVVYLLPEDLTPEAVSKNPGTSDTYRP